MMESVEGWLVIRVMQENGSERYHLFCTNRGGYAGDSCFLTDAINIDEIDIIDNQTFKLTDANHKCYRLTASGENGWTKWSRQELNRLIRVKEDNGERVEVLDDFFERACSRKA